MIFAGLVKNISIKRPKMPIIFLSCKNGSKFNPQSFSSIVSIIDLKSKLCKTDKAGIVMPIYTHLYIREQANALVEKNGITDAPVDVVKIAESLGIEIMEMANDLWFYGMLSRYEDNFYIIVNKLMPETRKRYAIAHEIGHFKLHGHDLEYQRAADDDYRHREADIFAEELCIPTNILKREAFNLMNNYKMLANTFRVSEPLMVKRMEELKLLQKGRHSWDYAGSQFI